MTLTTSVDVQSIDLAIAKLKRVIVIGICRLVKAFGRCVPTDRIPTRTDALSPRETSFDACKRVLRKHEIINGSSSVAVVETQRGCHSPTILRSPREARSSAG